MVDHLVESAEQNGQVLGDGTSGYYYYCTDYIDTGSDKFPIQSNLFVTQKITSTFL